MLTVVRTLFRARAFAVTSIATIALAIALGATVFAIVDGVLFKPLPYPDAEQLFQIDGMANDGSAVLSAADVRYLREAVPDAPLTMRGTPRGYRHANDPDALIWSVPVDADFFRVLGQHPLAGGFSGADFATTGGAGEIIPVIVSHRLWRQWLGASPSAIGTAFDLIDARMRVAGVLPADFVFPDSFGRTRPELLTPLLQSAQASPDRWSRQFRVVVRLPASGSLESVKGRYDSVMAARAAEYAPRPRSRPGPYTAVRMQPLHAVLGAAERPMFRAAFAAAALLIVLGCVNVGGLLTARGRDRERELAVRAALGASRRQLLTLFAGEALLIALCGAALGLLLAGPALTAAVRLLPESLLLMKAPAIDARVIAFSIAAATLTLLTVASLSVMSVVRGAGAADLATRTTTPRVQVWGRRAILVAESAIGVALIVAGTLAVAGAVTLRTEDVGFDRDGLAVVQLLTPGATRPDEQRTAQTRVLERLQAMPAVRGAAIAHVPFLENASTGTAFTLPYSFDKLFVNDVPVRGNFFDVVGLRLIAGRALTSEEIEGGRPVAVVSELTAQANWPEGRAVGQIIASQKSSVTIVGVVEEARFGSQADATAGELYLPGAFARGSTATFVVRTDRDPDDLARDLRLVINRDVPGVVVRRAESLDAALANSVKVHTFRGMLFGTGALASLLLVAVGVAGLVAMGVARRLRELGIRVALGARRAAIGRMIVLDHLWPVAAGIALGLIGSWWTTRFLSSLLYEIEARDPRLWALASLALLVVTAVAAWIPAHRASGVDPVSVLRAE